MDHLTLKRLVVALAAVFACAVGGCAVNRGEPTAGRSPPRPADASGDRAMRSAPIACAGTSSVDFILDIEDIRKNPTASIRLPLPSGNRVLLDFQRKEDFAGDTFAWIGRDPSEPGTHATLIVHRDTLLGELRTVGGAYNEFKTINGKRHRLTKIEMKDIPDGCPTNEPGVRADVANADADDAGVCMNDPPDEIDVMVIYTQDARAGEGSTDAMEARVYLAVSQANQSYIDSDINLRMNLVYMREVSYTESRNSELDRDRLKATLDGHLDEVHCWRDEHGADLVVLFTEALEPGIAGRAFIMTNVSTSFATSGFCVVKRTSSTGNFAFAHEIGHLMGCRHDWIADPSSNSPHLFNHGHGKPVPANHPTVAPWRTIMATRDVADATRIQYWSNPDIQYPVGGEKTDPLGVATDPQQCDNHKTIELTRSAVANFRCSGPKASNVWMKDSWADTGVEPDPLTAGERMHKSPYIWVRKTQDAQLLYQHQHENPEPGAQCYAYVKLHNGFNATTSGEVEIYYANASTSLDWPAAWTRIGAVPVVGLAAHATKVVELPWTPQQAGHFCLLARWVSNDDPMTVIETADLEANVRNNNNIVWRNLNVIDLSTADIAEASFAVHNKSPRRAVTSFTFTGPVSQTIPSFTEHGSVLVTLDPQLFNAWSEGGRKSSRVKLEGNALAVSPQGGRLDDIQLPPNFSGKVTIQFRRRPGAPRRDCELDVTQLSQGRVVGGVSYQVLTKPRTP